MTLFRVALLQAFAPGMDRMANLATGERLCRQAAGMGADLAHLPEMWSIGYTPPFASAWDDPFDPQQDPARQFWKAQAIDQRDPFLLHFRAEARELDMAIALAPTWRFGRRR